MTTDPGITDTLLCISVIESQITGAIEAFENQCNAEIVAIEITRAEPIPQSRQLTHGVKLRVHLCAT